MKKTLLLISAVTALLCSSCSYKRGLGMVNNEVLLRDWYGNAAFELSLSGVFRSNFQENSYVYSPSYSEEYDHAYYETDITLGLGAYGLLYRNDFLRLSTGIKYEAALYIDFRERGNHTFSGGFDYYSHEIYGSVRYPSYTVALVFPDLEICSPFTDDLKFIVKADLLRLSINFRDAFFSFSFDERNDTRYGDYYSGTDIDFYLPGDLELLRFSSTYVDLGNLKIGLVYYFK